MDRIQYIPVANGIEVVVDNERQLYTHEIMPFPNTNAFRNTRITCPIIEGFIDQSDPTQGGNDVGDDGNDDGHKNDDDNDNDEDNAGNENGNNQICNEDSDAHMQHISLYSPTPSFIQDREGVEQFPINLELKATTNSKTEGEHTRR